MTGTADVSPGSDSGGSAAGNLQSYSYLGLGTIVQQADGNGVSLSYIQQSGDTQANTDGGDQYTGLDRFGRVIDQNWVNTSTGVSTDRFQYGYDRDGNVLYKNNLVNSSFSELYHANSATTGDSNAGYDPLNRLTGFSRGTLSSSGNNGATLDTVASSTHSQSWSLDQLGNWNSVTTDGTAQSRTTNAKNEVTAAGTSSLTFDSNGNTTTDNQAHTLVYDAWNRLVSVKNGGTTLAGYTYDAQARRITEAHGSTPTDLYYSQQWQVLEERTGGATTKQYIWGLGYVDDLLLRDDNSVTGNLGKSGSGLGQRLYAQHDANYSVTALVGTGGQVKERFAYDPYGAVSFLAPNWSPATDAYTQSVLFQGGRFDASSNSYEFQLRDYDPAMAKWRERDPAGYVESKNLFEFVSSNPATKRDPAGLSQAPKWMYDLAGVFKKQIAQAEKQFQLAKNFGNQKVMEAAEKAIDYWQAALDQLDGWINEFESASCPFLGPWWLNPDWWRHTNSNNAA